MDGSALRLPFTAEQFVDSFHYYDVVVWPTQLLLYRLGLGAVALALKGGAARRS